MVLSMAPLHFIDQDDQHEMLDHLYGHVMPLALDLALCDVDGVINGIITFPTSG